MRQKWWVGSDEEGLSGLSKEALTLPRKLQIKIIELKLPWKAGVFIKTCVWNTHTDPRDEHWCELKGLLSACLSSLLRCSVSLGTAI